MIRKFTYSVVCAVAFASLGSATVLTPATSGAASGFGNSGWTLLATTGVQALSSGTFTADAEAWVYSDTNNSFCSGCLDFVYLVTRTGGNDSIERITAGSFAGFGTDVGFLTGSPGITPATIDRSSDGGVIGFNYLGVSSLTGVEGTQVLVIETDALSYAPGLMSSIDSQSANGVGFKPAAVPEPVSFAMLGTGLAILGLLRRRRKP